MRIVALVVLCLLFVTAGCAPGANDSEKQTNSEGELASFWEGVWHSVILPITVPASFISNDVHFYETHNDGNWYNFGFFSPAIFFWVLVIGKTASEMS